MPAAVVNVVTAVTTEIVPAPGAGARIRVLGFFMVAAAAQTWKLQTATTDIFPAAVAAAGVPQSFGPIADGILDCAPNEALQIVTSAAVQLSGWINYAVIPA
jgi:hypothetical protein